MTGASDKSLTRQFHDLVPDWSRSLTELGEWWLRCGLDNHRGGVIGEVSHSGSANYAAPKGVIAQARMCWFFSEFYSVVQDSRFAKAATSIRDFIVYRFLDHANGGIYWEVDAQGQKTNGRKQAYAHAFVIYGLAAHARACNDTASLDVAMRLFETMEERFLDRNHGGYWEAFAENWAKIDDVRLSDKDLPSPKSMNTHLHILEAYSELYAASPTPKVGKALRSLIELHINRIFDPSSKHLKLFWSDDWVDQSTEVSFGHDIEASWLIWLAAQRLGDDRLSERIKPVILTLVEVTRAEGVGAKGEVYNERSLIDGHVDKSRIWWVQAEAMVGHMNARQMTGQEDHLQRVSELWSFIDKYILLPELGEWAWYSRLDDRPAPYLTGAWKTAYHNGRALIECISRSEQLINAQH